MKTVRVLLINHYAGSLSLGMEFRPYYLAREWQKAGHEVTILSGDYSHLRICNPSVVRDLTEEEIDGINFLWLKTGIYEGNGVARAMTMFKFVRKLRRYAKKIATRYKPQVVIASSTYPLDTYGAQKISRLAQARLIHEVHDMWPSTLYEIGGMSKAHPFVRLMQLAEDSAYKESDWVVSIPPLAKDYMMKHGLREDKFVHINNGVDEKDWTVFTEMPEMHSNKLKQLKKDGKFVVGYYGGHALSNNLEFLIDVAAREKDDSIVFVLVGKGVEKPDLIQYAKKMKATNVVFLPPVNKSSIPALSSELDCAFICSPDSSLNRFGMSMNKIFDYMMAGLPVVCAITTPDRIIEDNRCGIQIDAGDTNGAVAAIEALKNMDPNERRLMGQRGHKMVSTHYAYSVLSARFSTLFERE